MTKEELEDIIRDKYDELWIGDYPMPEAKRIAQERVVKRLSDAIWPQIEDMLKVDAELCGDYPAPCNCNDPLIHDGH